MADHAAHAERVPRPPPGAGSNIRSARGSPLPTAISILVYTHKPFAFPRDSTWLRPMLSTDCPTAIPGALRNDVGDNIARLEKHFNELTAIYWLWKNQPACDIAGLYHYRRYLNFLPAHPQPPEVFAASTADAVAFLSHPQQRQKLVDILATFDVIVPQGNFLGASLEADYLAHHARKYWDRFWEIAFDTYPDYARFRDFLRLTNKAHFFNIFVSSKSWLDRYAQQLFGILEVLTSQLGFPEPEPEKRFQEFRYPGYLAERFFMFYLFANRSRVHETQLVLLEKDR